MDDQLRVADVSAGGDRPSRPSSRSGTAIARSRTPSSTSGRTGSRRRWSRRVRGAGSRIAHLDRTAPEVVELLAAVSKLGAVAVPLNWRLAAPELTRIVADAAAPLLIAGPAYGGMAAARRRRRAAALDIVAVGDEYETWLASFDAVDPGAPRRGRRRGGADVHVRDHGGAEGCADDAPQPRGGDAERPGLALRPGVRQPDAAADVPRRRHRVDVPGPVCKARPRSS